MSEQRDWIERTSRELPQLPSASALPDVINLAALGFRYELLYGGIGRRRFAVQQGNELHVPAGKGEPSLARNQLRKWLAGMTRTYIVPRLDDLAKLYGFRYDNVSVRGQRTRWGSCSARKNISINYKLLFLAPELVDYLLVHELAHTRQLDHSARFWRVVETCLPEYRDLEARMKRAWRDVPGWVEIP